MNQNEDLALARAIRDRASRHRAPAELHQRIAAALSEPLAPPASDRARPAIWRSWRALAGAFACGVVASWAFVHFRPAPADDYAIVQEVLAGHVRSLMVSHLADIASSDQHSVKPWFAGKLDYSPPVRDLAAEGFPLIGGRLDYIDQRPVAALVYRRYKHTINLFVWPADGAAPGPSSLARNGFNIVDWRDAGMQFWAVSDLEAGELQTFARLQQAAR